LSMEAIDLDALEREHYEYNSVRLSGQHLACNECGPPWPCVGLSGEEGR